MPNWAISEFLCYEHTKGSYLKPYTNLKQLCIFTGYPDQKHIAVFLLQRTKLKARKKEIMKIWWQCFYNHATIITKKSKYRQVIQWIPTSSY